MRTKRQFCCTDFSISTHGELSYHKWRIGDAYNKKIGECGKSLWKKHWSIGRKKFLKTCHVFCWYWGVCTFAAPHLKNSASDNSPSLYVYHSSGLTMSHWCTGNIIILLCSSIYFSMSDAFTCVWALSFLYTVPCIHVCSAYVCSLRDVFSILCAQKDSSIHSSHQTYSYWYDLTYTALLMWTCEDMAVQNNHVMRDNCFSSDVLWTSPSSWGHPYRSKNNLTSPLFGKTYPCKLALPYHCVCYVLCLWNLCLRLKIFLLVSSLIQDPPFTS